MSGSGAGQAGEEAYRETRFGAVLGAAAGNALVWYGIPYAAPPVGDRRWRAPAPPAEWSGVCDATRRPPPAAQVLSFSTPDGEMAEGQIVGDEDCLYLTIWAPRRAGPPDARLPVLVWFHGGGNMIGDGARFDASRLAASQNVIVVSVNHRLNILGWLAHRALRAGDTSPEERSGNFAVLDHIAALDWVQVNIAAFGGDPGRVTIFGHSGGGWNVRALLCAPLARGLFHRAIVQSVGAYQLLTPPHAENFLSDDVPGHPLSSGELLVSLWLADGRASGVEAAIAGIRAASDADLTAYLRAQPFEALTRAISATSKRNAGAASSESLTRHTARRLPQMFADGVVVTDSIQSRVPIMVGTTRYEDRTFLSADRKFVTTVYGHPVIRDSARYAILSDYLGKLYAAHATVGPATEWTRQGLEVYAYRCDWDDVVSPAWADFRTIIGACHGSELPLIFGTTDLGAEYRFQRHLYDESPSGSFREVSGAMMAYWSAFARDGAPGRGGGKLAEWRAWNDGETMILDGPRGGGIHLSAEALSKAGVIAQMRSDPRVSSGSLRRRLVQDLRGHSITQLSAADYEFLES